MNDETLIKNMNKFAGVSDHYYTASAFFQQSGLIAAVKTVCEEDSREQGLGNVIQAARLEIDTFDRSLGVSIQGYIDETTGVYAQLSISNIKKLEDRKEFEDIYNKN